MTHSSNNGKTGKKYVFDHSDLDLGRGIPTALRFHLLMRKLGATVAMYNGVVKFINNKLEGREARPALPSLYKNKMHAAMLFRVQPKWIPVCNGGCRA